MMSVKPPPHPTEIRLSDDHHSLVVVFNSGESFVLAAEYLRVESPSAEVRGHSPSERKILGGCRQVTINRLEPVGHYAVRILFSDGHDTGLYSWAYLYELGHDFDRIWTAYLTALASKGLSRD